jgi:hypothetical protein
MVPVIASQLLEQISHAGLRDIELHGSYEGETWTKSSPATVVTARAPGY